jgi:glycosyltransferase involved in cell wall biosynthesis
VIPVLGVPYLTRSDLMVRLITSINHPVGEIVVIDNSNDGSCPQVDGSKTARMWRNMGVAWAWNTIIKMTPKADWWAIVNSDIQLGPADLQNLEAAMVHHDLVLVHSMALFGISPRAIKVVGWFNEMYCPAYCEDNEYVYRARLLGVEPIFLEAGFDHFGSATIKSDPGRRKQNDRTYPENVKYYTKRWGGVMHQEKFTTPFDQGGSPRDCETLDIDRLRELSWD